MKVGWIGTGVLGEAIVKRLLQKGHQVIVYNRTIEKTEVLISEGAQLASSPRDVSLLSDCLFLCLKGHEATDSVLFNPVTGVVAAQRTQVVVDTSTVHPSFAINLSQRLHLNGIAYLDAPVSGGPEGALKGKLSSILSGDEAMVGRMIPIIREYSETYSYVGSSGRAQLLKIMNNLAESVNLLAAAEVVSLGLAAGFDLYTMKQVLSTTRGYSVYMDVLLNRLLQPEGKISASLQIRVKDLELAHDVAREYNVATPIGGMVEQLFRLAMQKIGNEADQTECIKLY